jgi:ubiquinone/menaquinone biosynthesis C-methylase UbiE
MSRWVVGPQQTRLLAELSPALQEKVETVVVGDRWLRGIVWRAFNESAPKKSPHGVLVVGCGSAMGHDVGVWLENGVHRVHACDLIPQVEWPARATELSTRHSADVKIFACPAEDLAVADRTYDLVYSTTVFEHVKDIRKAVRESARALTDDGVSFHVIGPLYFSHGGDHCISAYGTEHGYDHLLLDKTEYQKMVQDDQFFAGTADPWQAGWAKFGMFSYGKPMDYVQAFADAFQRFRLIVTLSEDGLNFRRDHPEKWRKLRDLGLTNDALLVKGLTFLASKPVRGSER